MNKKVPALSLLLAFSVVAAACGTEKAPQSGEANSNGGQPVKLQFWEGDRHDMDFISERVKQFNEENKGKIEVELKVMSENYYQAVDIAFTSNQAPDILRVGEGNFLNISKKGYLEPLNDYMSDEMKKQYAPVLVEGLNTLNGKTYSLPNFGYTKRLIYNVDMFEKAGIKNPPTTLQEMVEVAKKITEVGKKDGVYGFAANLKNPKSALDRSLVAMSDLSGVSGFGYDFKTGKFDFSGQKPIVQAWRQMMQDGSFLPGSEALDIDPLRAQFAEGKIGMYISVSAEVGVYKDQFPAKIKWASAPVPTIDGSKPGAASLGNAGFWLAVASTSKHKEEAYKFLSYMHDTNFLTQYHEKGLGLSLVPAVLEKAKKPDVPNIEGFLPTKYDALWPVAPDITVEGRKFQDAYVKYMLEGGNLDAVIDDLNKRYNAALDKAKQAGTVSAQPDPDFSPAKLQGMFVK